MDTLDLRSDTVTRPSAAMRDAMRDAEVGDDVYGEDPTINRLEARAAALFGREAALLFPTGCMANLAAILVHATPGSEAICEGFSHALNYEQASAARVGGVQLVPIEASDGVPCVEKIRRAIRPSGDAHLARTALCIVENTHNMRGGRVVPLERLREISALCRERGIALHIDGARIFNAAVASGTAVAEYGALADTIMCCLSKGLGAPVGSMLVGDGETISRAHAIRKMLGGGMRQAGVLAAAGLLAMSDESIASLASDHAVATALGEGLATIDRVQVLAPVETNIVLFGVEGIAPAEVEAGMLGAGVLCGAVDDQFVRLVTHRDLPDDVVPRTLAAAARVANGQD